MAVPAALSPAIMMSCSARPLPVSGCAARMPASTTAAVPCPSTCKTCFSQRRHPRWEHSLTPGLLCDPQLAPNPSLSGPSQTATYPMQEEAMKSQAGNKGREASVQAHLYIIRETRQCASVLA